MSKIFGGVFGGLFGGMKSSCVMRLIAYKLPIIHCVLLICEQV